MKMSRRYEFHGLPCVAVYDKHIANPPGFLGGCHKVDGAIRTLKLAAMCILIRLE